MCSLTAPEPQPQCDLHSGLVTEGRFERGERGEIYCTIVSLPWIPPYPPSGRAQLQNEIKYMPCQRSINLSNSVHVHVECVKERRPKSLWWWWGGFSSEDRTVNLAEVKAAAVLCLRQAASNWVMILWWLGYKERRGCPLAIQGINCEQCEAFSGTLVAIQITPSSRWPLCSWLMLAVFFL